MEFSEEVTCLMSVSGHTGSIRAVSVCDVEGNKGKIVTGGGLMRLFLWEMEGNGRNVVVRKLSSREIQGEVDQRVMSIDTLGRVVVAGDSGGQLHVFTLETIGTGAQFTPRNSFKVAPLSVILCVKLWMGLSAEVSIVLGTTSGHISIYLPNGDLISQSLTHQLGVNCMYLLPMDSHKVVILTGGDDQCIVSSLYTVGKTVTRTRVIVNAHDSAVKGMTVVGENTLITGSWDGELKLWSLPNLDLMSSLPHYTGDISSISSLNDTVIVAGLGLEWFHLPTSSALPGGSHHDLRRC